MMPTLECNISMMHISVIFKFLLIDAGPKPIDLLVFLLPSL